MDSKFRERSMSAQNLQNFMPAQNCGQQCAPANYYPTNYGAQLYSTTPVPQSPQPIQAEQLSAKGGGVSTINITVNGAGQSAFPAYYPAYIPCYYPNYGYYSQQPSQNIGVQGVKQEIKLENPTVPPAEKKPEEKKPEEKKPENKKPVIPLTDEYIKKLEKDLLSDDNAISGKAVAELVNRFKEDETRKDEPRLTNLLNLALQNRSKPAVLTAMQAFEGGYANGNNLTVQRLQQIRDAGDSFGNSETAQGILTEMERRKTSATAPVKENLINNKPDLTGG
jgi:hypothetical protein